MALFGSTAVQSGSGFENLETDVPDRQDVGREGAYDALRMSTTSESKQDTFRNRVKIPSVPNLVHQEAFAALAAGAFVCVLSAVLDAPLEGPADVGGIPAHAVKAPWIFLGVQQLLRVLPTALAGIVLPLTALACLAVIPLIPSGKRALAAVLFFGIILVSGVLTLWGLIR